MVVSVSANISAQHEQSTNPQWGEVLGQILDASAENIERYTEIFATLKDRLEAFPSDDFNPITELSDIWVQIDPETVYFIFHNMSSAKMAPFTLVSGARKNWIPGIPHTLRIGIGSPEALVLDFESNETRYNPNYLTEL